jgi:dihydrofolate reductase
MGNNTFGKKMHYVFSNTLKKTSGDTEIISKDVSAHVKNIKAMKGKDIWLFGGASLTTSLLNEGLVDELSLAVHPVLLGGGKPLLQGLKGRIKTKLLDFKTYHTGLVSLSYQVL